MNEQKHLLRPYLRKPSLCSFKCKKKKKDKKGQYFNLFANMRLLTHLDNILYKQLMDNADEYHTLKWQAYNNTLTFYFYTNYTLVKIGGIHAYSTIWNKVICHHCTTSLWVFFFIPLKHLVSINASKCIYIFDQNKLLIVEMFILCLFIIVIFFLSFLLQMLQYVVCQNSFSM